jgi:lipopolysaccharide/colanic/teichoic acid biosynthesis glycosyltransferase
MFLGTLFGFMLVYIFRLKWAAFPSSIFAISFPLGILLISCCNILILRIARSIRKIVVIVGQEREDNIFGNHSIVEKIKIENIEEILLHQDADEIVLCENIHEDSQLNLLLFLLLKSRIKVVFSPSLYADILSGNLTEENSIEFIATFLGRKTEWEEFLIRSLDIVVSFTIFIISLPIMIFISTLIKGTSNGPVFYLQKRAGKDGKLFTLVKFRTMVDGAENETGPVLASNEDWRITKIGKFLRQTRLDELPQVFNVLKGSMSMVGPRPERPHFVKQHKALRGIRLAVKPGLTGFAQVSNADQFC